MQNRPLTYEVALHKSAAYCSKSEHCIADLMKKFSQWEVRESDRNKLLRYLIAEKYIDENRYATAFVKDKFKYNKWGKLRIKLELSARKIDNKTIENALEQIDETSYLEMIKRLVKEKEKNIRFQNEYERKGKLFRYLSGKGYESEWINEALADSKPAI